MMKHVYSVGQVNKYIKNMFAQDFMLHHISIKGEVSNCKYHSSGHIYFTMKDADGTINAVMFAGSRREGLKFPMKEGDRVVVTGSVEVYERDGRYQIYARTIERDGEGNLYLKFEALKRELEEMGMFAEEYKQPIPTYAKTVGIVTAETGAAIQDIRNIAGRRNPYVQLILCPALVQGEGAAASIVHGIHALEQIGVDVIIVGRGGGSIEDLWAFNDERVARAIYDSGIPVISAVGHEPDVTISDFVADLRAATPSNAAELAVPNAEDLRETLRSYDIRMTQAMRKQMTQRRAALENLAGRRVLQSPAAYFDLRRVELDYTRSRLTAAGERYLASRRRAFAQCAAALDAMSPLKVLGRGYAVASDAAGAVLRSAAQVQPGDAIRVQLQDGALHCTVNNREEAHGKTETDL